jgi:hypothetical protein
MNAAEIILLVAGLYTAIGAVFGVAFVAVGAARVDHAAAGSPWSFRLLIWPGAAALWPLMLAKWIRAARPGRMEPKP